MEWFAHPCKDLQKYEALWELSQLKEDGQKRWLKIKQDVEWDNMYGHAVRMSDCIILICLFTTIAGNVNGKFLGLSEKLMPFFYYYFSVVVLFLFFVCVFFFR